jgi:PleD family two-component response regulator
MDKILIVDDDPYVRDLLRSALGDQYEVLVASSGEEAIDVALTSGPRLILLDVVLPGLDGREVCLRLRSNPRTCHAVIVILTGRNTEQHIVQGLRAGADDYLVKPFNISELCARVNSHLRRQARELQANPLTGLPGNNAIEQVIRTSIAAQLEFAVCHADINRFKSYNDKYGFSDGDRVIVFCAELLTLAVAGHGRSGLDFVGHIGGDDFVVIAEPDGCRKIAQSIVDGFDKEVRRFYSREDLDRGGIETTDRVFKVAFAPIISVSLAIVISDGSLTHPGQISQAAAELKNFLKRNSPASSCYMIDRRSHKTPSADLSTIIMETSIQHQG